MSRISNDDQFQFLISCIRHSNNGKIDYTEVARECSIVSRGAAVKRYSRMMKAHGINTGETTNSATTTGSAIPSPKKAKTNGKRKNAADSETEAEIESKSKAKKGKMKGKAVESAEKLVMAVKEGEEEALVKIKGEVEDSE